MTPSVYQWAIRHGVTLAALQELAGIFGMHGGHDLPPEVKGTSEAAVQAAVRQKLLDRSKVGLSKYGVTTERSDLDLVAWMRHLQEELLDAAVYIEAAVKRIEGEKNG